MVLTADSENQRRAREYEREVAELHEQTKLLEEEVVKYPTASLAYGYSRMPAVFTPVAAEGAAE